MTDQELIAKTAKFMKAKFAGESSGHDWWHLYRVWQLAKQIAAKEKGANATVVELGALLHDIADFKFHNGDLSAGPKAARVWLQSLNASEETIQGVCHIVEHVSFKGAGVANKMKSLEGRIVQDADRLDAIGAVGIARVFAFGGAHNRLIHDPDIQPQLHDSFETYATATPTAINHFYEKLLLLKDKMNTKTGQQMAARRHEFMEKYLQEFYAEWNGGV